MRTHFVILKGADRGNMVQGGMNFIEVNFLLREQKSKTLWTFFPKGRITKSLDFLVTSMVN